MTSQAMFSYFSVLNQSSELTLKVGDSEYIKKDISPYKTRGFFLIVLNVWFALYILLPISMLCTLIYVDQ